MTLPEFPKYEYSYQVMQLLFEQGTMVVKFLPTNPDLMSITYNIPIWPEMDLQNLKPYLDKWAPNDKWFAQELILNNGNNLLGSAT